MIFYIIEVSREIERRLGSCLPWWLHGYRFWRQPSFCATYSIFGFKDVDWDLLLGDFGLSGVYQDQLLG